MKYFFLIHVYKNAIKFFLFSLYFFIYFISYFNYLDILYMSLYYKIWQINLYNLITHSDCAVWRNIKILSYHDLSGIDKEKSERMCETCYFVDSNLSVLLPTWNVRSLFVPVTQRGTIPDNSRKDRQDSAPRKGEANGYYISCIKTIFGLFRTKIST